MSQSLFFMPPYDWANSMVVLADIFFGVVSMVLVLWELVLFYELGVEFKGKIFLKSGFLPSPPLPPLVFNRMFTKSQLKSLGDDPDYCTTILPCQPPHHCTNVIL